MEWILPALLIVVMIAVLVVRRRLPKSTQLVVCEYWVYLPEPKLPKIEAIMTAMISENPHAKPGRPCIGAREGMLFSDIRLHMAIVRREKNAQLFRPDLFHSAVEPTAETLSRLSQARAFAKLRYLSEEPLADRRHLQFMPHLAETVSRLGQGTVVFDVTQDSLFTSEQFFSRLQQLPNQERIDQHLRVVAFPAESGVRIESRGLQKIGMPELISDDLPPDEETLGVAAFEEAAGQLWTNPRELPVDIEFECLGQLIRVSITQTSLSEARVKLARVFTN